MRVYANEHLSRKNPSILTEARKSKDFFLSWLWKGGIFYRPKLDKSQTRYLSSEAEAKKLMSTLSEVNKETITKANQARKSMSKPTAEDTKSQASQAGHEREDG